MSRNNLDYVFITPTDKYLAISDNKLHYSILSDLLSCNQIPYVYVCKSIQPTRSTHIDPICEISLLLGNTDIEALCNFREIKLTKEIW